MVPLAERKIIRIVRRRNLHCPCAEFAADPLVKNDRNLAPHQRQSQLLAVQMLVPFVLGMNRNRHIAQHRFRPRCRNG